MLIKLTIYWLVVVVNLVYSQDDSWYGMGDWDTPPSHQSNPYYLTYQYMQNQMSLFGFAQHVGKINRGHLVNPELNRPRDRAFGYQNDFNYEDFKLGAFRNPSKGQKIRVSQVLLSIVFLLVSNRCFTGSC